MNALARPSRLSARAFWGLASWALPLGVVFVLSPKLLHLLGAERFGVLMIVLVTPLVASQFDFGICSAAVRRLAGRIHHGRVDAGATLFTLFIALLLVGIGLGAILWISARPLSEWLGFAQTLGPEQGRDLVRSCAIWATLSLATLAPGLVARAIQALALITLVQTTASVVLWLGAWSLLQRDVSLVSITELGMCLTVCAAGVTLLATRRAIDWSGPLRFELRQLSEEAHFSAGMFAAQVASAIVYQGDRILVAALGSTAMAGLYSLCVNIANKTVAAVVAINSFVMPHAAGLEAIGNRDATIGLIHALDRAVAVLLIPFLVPALLLAAPFFRLWLGGFATPELVMAFQTLFVSFAIPAFAMPVSNVLIASGGAGLSARYAWLTVGVVLGSMAALVPRFGLIGAAAAMLLGNTTSLLFAASARRTLNVPAASGRRRFWYGVALGCVVQFGLVLALASLVSGWTTLLMVCGFAWVSFYVARAIVFALSPEEQQLLQRLTGNSKGV